MILESEKEEEVHDNIEWELHALEVCNFLEEKAQIASGQPIKLKSTIFFIHN